MRARRCRCCALRPGRRHRLRADRTLGQAVRARAPGRSDHGRGSDPVVLVHGPRLRGARGCARRHRRRRRRLRLHLMTGHAWRDPRRRVLLALAACRRARGGAARRSRRHPLPPLRRRRRDGRRPFGAGAQEVRGALLRHGQLLRRHDLQRLDRRGHDGQPVYRAARAEEPRVDHRTARRSTRSATSTARRATTRPTRCSASARTCSAT